jgi:hypothetical protein
MSKSFAGKLRRVFGIAPRRDPLPDLPAAALRERVAGSTLFDSSFYSSTYLGNIPGVDPLDHFLSEGLTRGYLPSPHFDPVLYRLTVPGCGDSNPLLHWLEYGNGRPAKGVTEVFPDLIAKFAKKPRAEQGSALQKEKVERYIKNRGRIADQREVSFQVGGEDYKVLVPPMSFFIERFQSERPFAFARLPHGFWDGLAARQAIAADSRLSRLSVEDRLRLADRIAGAALPHHGVFTEGFMDEMVGAIARHKREPDFFSSVGFKGFFDATDGMFRASLGDHQKQVRLELYCRHFSASDQVYDATVWKRFADSDQLWSLAEVCRERHVVLLGPDYLGDLGDRWNLRRYTYVAIGRSHSQRVRWQVLDRLKAALSAAATQPGHRPVLLTMCGGSFAYWLLSHLFAWRRDIFYIDLGQSIRIWFPDVQATSPWMNVYLSARKQLEGTQE